MSVYYQDEQVTVHHGDCLDALQDLPDSSVHAVVTDPPYGLANTTPEQVADTLVRWVNGDREYLPSGSGFMGKAWDAFVPPAAVWDECLRVLKPGGHAVVFAGSRTVDLMTLGLRLAGFEIRDSIAWLYGSGFPKSLDVSKAIDKAAGAAREVVGQTMHPDGKPRSLVTRDLGIHEGGQRLNGVGLDITAPATPDAARWQGWGTALKPAFEPIVVARKPMNNTVAANVLEHGTGALNIDACRVGTDGGIRKPATEEGSRTDSVGAYLNATAGDLVPGLGRWPANVTLDDTQAAELDKQSGETSYNPAGTFGTQKGNSADSGDVPYGSRKDGDGIFGYGDRGGASRFFPTFRYEAKAPTDQRPRYNKSVLRLRAGLTPEQVGHVRARLAEAGVRVD